MNRFFTVLLSFFFSFLTLVAYSAPPVVSGVTITAGNYKIGSSITITIATNGTGYTVDAGTTINGVDVTSTFASAGGNNYTLIYLVAAGNTDRASVGAIPINILIRNGAGAGNLNTYTTAATSGGTVTIDANAPTASGTPTNTGGAVINSTENGAFDITVGSLGATGAVAGDVLELFLGGASFSTPLTHTLAAGDISGGYTFTNVTLPGADGAKVITAKVIDQAGNTGAASAALNLTLDTTAPTAPGTPTNTAGAVINSTENGAFDITVGSLGATGAAAGDVLELFVGGVSFSTPLIHTLTAGDISGGYTFTNVTLPGADGAKVITAKVTDQAGNTGAASAALNLTLDTTAPTAPGTPTNTGGAVINSAENGAFDITVGSLGATGAVAGDVLELFVGGVSFPTPFTRTLVAGDISGGYTFTNVTLPGADGAKVITAKVIDQAGNTGTASAALNLTLDTTAPTAPGTPTNTAGAVINSVENGAFDITVGSLGATGAVAGDVLELFIGGVSFPTPLTRTLVAGDISGNYTFTNVTLPGADGAKVITAKVIDQAGNTGAASAALNLTLDTSAPTVNSHNINTVIATGFTFTINLSETGTTYYDVTTSSSTPTAAQIKAGTSTGHVQSGNFAIGTASTNVNQAITGLSGGTTYYLYSVSEDAAGNPSVVTNDVTSTSCVAPTGQPTLGAFTSVTAGAMTINWSGGTGLDGVLVVVRAGSAVSFVPSSGNDYSGQVNANITLATDQGSGNIIVFRGNGSNVTLSNLSASTTYHIAIYAYKNSGNCYLTTSPATGSQSTPAPAGTSTLTNGTGVASVASTVNSNNAAGAVFTFTLTDVGGDNTSTRLSQLIFREVGTFNPDLTQLIADAQLLDNSGGTVGQQGAAVIGTHSITIPNILSGNPNQNTNPQDLGSIPDNSSKIYTLRIWFKSALGGTLPSTIDNKQLLFSLVASDVTIVPGKTQIKNSGAGSSVLSNESGTTDVVTVTATKITVDTQPSTTATAGLALTTQPKFSARDANNNIDLDFNNSITINTTNPTNLGPASAPASFTNGVADFAASGFKFNNVGSSTMSVTANSITSPATSSITVSSNVQLGASAATLAASPLVNSTTNKAVFAFSLATTGNAVTLTNVTINSSVSPVNLVKNLRLYSNTTDSFTGATQIAASGTLTFSGLSVALNGTAKYFFLVVDVEDYFSTSLPSIQFSLPLTGITVSPAGKSGGTQTGATYTLQDNTAPVVSNITLPSANPNNTSSVNFTVTFSEPVTGVDALDFTTYGTASTGTIISGVTGTGNTYTVTVSNILSTGTLGLNVVDNNSIHDARPNTLGGPATGDGNFSSASTYTFILPEPPFHVSGFTATVQSTSSVELNWTDAPGNPLPAGYLITVAKSGFSAVTPTDYQVEATQTNLVPDANTVGYVYVPAGVGTYTFASLLSGIDYTFKIYPYTNSGSTIDYKTSGAPIATASTGVAANATIGAGISGTSTVPTVGTANVNFQFWVWDGNSPGDNAPTKISSIVIQRNTVTDQIGNWTNAILSAELSEAAVGLSEITGAPARIATGSDIASNSITFSNLLSDAFGRISNGGYKYYNLKLNLKSSLGGSLPQTIDGLNFRMQVGTATITLAPGSTGYSASSTVNAPDATVSVIATQLDFSTQPGSTQLVLRDVTSASSSAPDFSLVPVARARDINGNTDRDFNSDVTISNAGGLPMTQNLITPVAGVISFPTSFQYTDDGSGTTNNGDLTITASGLTSATSSHVTVSYSNNTTITAGAFAEPLTLSSLRDDLAGFNYPSVTNKVFDFNINDDNNILSSDGSPTRISEIVITQSAGNDLSDWTAVIAAARLYDGSGFFINGTVNADKLIFTGINTSTLGFINDNLTKNYQLYITLKSDMGTLAATIDGQNLAFEVLASNINTTNQSSTIAAGEFENSGSNNLAIDVTATKLVFTTQPPATASVDTDLSIQPVVTAYDKNNNLDFNYAGSITITTTNAGSLVMSNAPISISSGILTFPSNFQYRQAGNGTLTVSSGGLTSAISTPVTVSFSSASDIIHDVSFSYPNNIAYKDYQSSIILQDGNSIDMERFVVRDGGVAANDPDGAGTSITAISIQATNHQNLRTVALYDGGTKLGQAAPDGTGLIIFSGLNFQVIDGQSKAFTIRASFTSAVTDNDVISFLVTSVTKGTSIGFGSGFAAADGGGASSTISSDNNKIEVVATQLDFTTPSSASSASLNSPFTVVVKARDINGNVDMDFNSAVTSLTNATSASMSNSPVGNNFVSGVLNFPLNFQFTSGNNNDDVTLSIAAGGVNSITPPAPTTPKITLTSSFESLLIVDTASPTSDLPYKDYQDISTSATSIVLTQFKLLDGDGVTPDLDGASTNIQDIQFSITNPSNIRSLGIYLGNTLVQSKNNADFNTPAGTTFVTFTSLSGSIIAPDNGSVLFTVRASFFDTNTAVHDWDDIQLKTVSITQNGGSKFNTTGVAPLIGGITNGSIPASRKIEAIATRLDFINQPASIEGVDQPITEPLVQARDENGVIDFDHSFVATLSSGASLSASSLTFVKGVLNFTGFQYTSSGNGTLTVSSNGLSSIAGGSNSCTNVEVIHTTAVIAIDGVLTSNNIKGGTAGAVLFGVTFKPENVTSSEPSLNSFTFAFDKSYQTSSTTTLIPSSFKVYESTSASYNSSTNVTSLGATVSPASSTGNSNLDLVTVNFSTPRSLYQGITRSYFLVADVDVSANISTPTLKPSLIDEGYGTATDSHIVTTVGSSKANVIGQEYKFASTRPPKLISSVPSNGQLNVNPALTEIALTFDVNVLSFDSTAYLYDRQNNILIATLKATTGLYNPVVNLSSSTTNPLKFAIQLLPGKSLKPDSVYYVTLAKGSFNPITKKGTGISDDGLNFYGGISYNGTLYFKISSPNPPKMVATDATSYFASKTAAVFNASFDIPGTAYYIVTAPGLYNNSTITNTIVKNGIGGITSGKFDINQLSPKVQYASFAANLSTYATYDVWIYAENDATPTPVSTSAPYGKFITAGNTSNFAVGGVGPTLTLTPTTAANHLPIYQVCPNSTVMLSDPIIIGESTSGQFSGGNQEFNVLLPTGFLYDITNTPTVKLNGLDFNGILPTLSYINNSVLNIKLYNSGSISIDNIIISNLRISSSASATGSIIRFSGTGLSSIPTNLATITTVSTQTPDFSNTYNNSNDFGSIGIASVVNVIPDNFNAPAGTVRLIPPSTPNDYGSSFFSGLGVTNDILSLNGLANSLGTAFDITMTHTDMNGCVIQKVEQYMVYDHTKAIPVFGTKQSIANPNFPADAPNQPVGTLNYSDIAGYSLIKLYAKIPPKVVSGQTDQIIKGSDWESILKKVPIVTDSLSGNSGQIVRNYNWDYSYILNAVSKSNGAITTNPYDYFKGGKDGSGTPNGQPYWTGGSLGLIEFIGNFQSTADYSLFVPIRQEVELFVPPVPVLEINNKIVTGITTYCENDGAIVINGYPQAATGSSVGTFLLTKLADGTTISPALNTVFSESGSGTATINPSLINGYYGDLKITYTYKETNSPASGTTSLIIRIAPNPIANFTYENIITTNSPTTLSFCEGKPIQFNSTSSISNGFSISSLEWNFKDANATSELNTSTINAPTHKYSTSAKYSPTLMAISNTGCKSIEVTKDISVGAIPVTAFSLIGVSTADQIVFTNLTAINSAAAVNDGFKLAEWSYGDGQTASVTSNFTSTIAHQYTNPKVYPVSLKVTSIIGCVEEKINDVIIVPKKTPTEMNAYLEDFEINDGGWQNYKLNSSNVSSWESGRTSKIQPLDGSKVWATNLTGPYGSNERSALYSPSFDMSDLERPMISFNFFHDLEPGEGAVLEYSTDNYNIADTDPTHKKWIVLGKFENGQSTGVDWYNALGLSSQPGNQTTGFGWTGTAADWLEAKHILDTVRTQHQVVFRIAMATLKDVPTKRGLLVDNVRVGNRTRTVLVENFKNSGNNAATEKSEADFLKNKLAQNSQGTKLVKLNYHVGFPQVDPFNQDNPLDPSARALFYNIKSTPLARLDGDKPTGDEQLLSTWGQNWYNTQTLKLAEVTITPTVQTTAAGSIEVNVTVNNKSKQVIPAESTLLYVAVVEKSILKNNIPTAMQALIKSGETDFEYTVKKILPSGAGTRLEKGKPLAVNASLSFGPFSWIPESSKLYSKDDLAVVAFLQDETTKKVYQAEIINVGQDPGKVTGLEDGLRIDDVTLYPNPADEEINIQLPRKAIGDVKILLFDQMGKSVVDGTIKTGEQKSTLNVRHLAAGMYLMKLVENGVITMKKVVVVHQN